MKSLKTQEKADIEKGDLIAKTLRIMNVNVEKIKDRGGKFNDLEHGLRMPGKAFFPKLLCVFGSFNTHWISSLSQVG